MKPNRIIVAAAQMSCALVAHAQPLDQAAVSETEARGRACFHNAAVTMLTRIADEHARSENLAFAGGIASNPLGGMGGGYAAQLEQRNRQQAYQQQEQVQVRTFMVNSCGEGLLQTFMHLGMSESDTVSKLRQMLNEEYAIAARSRQ